MRGDKVGFIGPNGAGKTTLLRLILDELQPDSGEVRLGTRLSVAYYDQLRNQFDEEATVFDTVSEGSDFVEVGGAASTSSATSAISCSRRSACALR